MTLSKKEKAFLEGKLKPSPVYYRVLVHRIKKKRLEMLRELELIEVFLQKNEKTVG